jgi:hypothetical protein
LCALLGSCGAPSDDGSAPGPADNADTDSEFVNKTAPLVPTHHKGAVLDSPKIVTVVWKVDAAFGKRVEEFHRWMLQSPFWTNALGEYGVGAGTSGGLVVIDENPPATGPDEKFDDVDFTTLIHRLISPQADGSKPLVDMPNEQTILAFIVPKQTHSFTDDSPGLENFIEGDPEHPGECNNYFGYHFETNADLDTGVLDKKGKPRKPTIPAPPGAPEHILYSVNLQCPKERNPQTGKNLGPFEVLTATLSHEAAEAATDPNPSSHEGFSNDQFSSSGGEVGDFCGDLTAFVDGNGPDFSGKKFLVQRLYSTKRAQSMLEDPCLPAPPTAYLNAAVVPNLSVIHVTKDGNGSALIKLQPFAVGSKADLARAPKQVGWRFHPFDDMNITLTRSDGTPIPPKTTFFDDINSSIDIKVTATGTKIDDYGLEVDVLDPDTNLLLNQWFANLKVAKKQHKNDKRPPSGTTGDLSTR